MGQVIVFENTNSTVTRVSNIILITQFKQNVVKNLAV
jgi:hypothetical protein